MKQKSAPARSVPQADPVEATADDARVGDQVHPGEVDSWERSALSAVTQRAARELFDQGEAANTSASYRSAISYWERWYELRLGGPMTFPVPIDVVIQFIVDHLQRSTDVGTATQLVHELPAHVDAALVDRGFKSKLGPLSMATVMHRVSVLSKAHRLHRQPNPCDDLGVRELMTRARRGYAQRGVRQNKKDALTRPRLDKLLGTCDDSLTGLRDRALLLCGWASGGRRRSELVKMSRENTRQVEDGAWLFTLTHTKTNQLGGQHPDNDKPIMGAAAEALQAWLDASGIQSGPIFRRVRKGTTIGEPLSASAVRDILLRRQKLAAMEGNFSAHSIRSGFVTEAAQRNVPDADTMAMTGIRSVTTLRRYARPGGTFTNKGARLILADD